MDRMTKGICDVFNGIQFQNIMLNLERISDQCSDLQYTCWDAITLIS